MKFKLKDIDKKWQVYALAGCVCVLFYVILTHLGPIASSIGYILGILRPVFIGVAGAYIANPLALFLRKTLFKKMGKEKLAWTLSVVITLLIVLAFVTLLLAMIVPQTIESVGILVNRVKDFKLEETDSFLANITIVKDALDFINNDTELIGTIGQYIANNMQQILTVTSAVGNAAVNWGVGAIFAIYFLMAKDSITETFRKALKVFLSKKKYADTKNTLLHFNDIFSKYIVFELLDALIIGVACYVFMIIVGIPNAALISVVSAITNLIPTFGPVIGAAISSFILLVADPEAILPFLIFTVILQTIDAYVIKPKLFGTALSVPGFLILVAVIIFGKTMGIVGMLVAIPVAAFICFMTKEWFSDFAAQKELREYKEELREDEKGSREDK